MPFYMGFFLAKNTQINNTRKQSFLSLIRTTSSSGWQRRRRHGTAVTQLSSPPSVSALPALGLNRRGDENKCVRVCGCLCARAWVFVQVCRCVCVNVIYFFSFLSIFKLEP